MKTGPWRLCWPLVIPNLRVINNPGYISSKARNIGVANANSSYVLFVDGHCCVFYDNMLEEVVSAFARGESCVSRPQPQIFTDVTRFQDAVALSRNSFLGHYRCLSSKLSPKLTFFI